MAKTLYWHDYETFGADPRRDRPAQFAGLRTDERLEVVGDPLVVFCRPARDMLPQPEACLITGITPQQALREGLPEAEFIARVLTELARSGTCGVGYNSLRFDDEVTRFTLYRNLYDAYAREWQNGNSRWDVIDMVRLTYALRPQGIEWPRHDDGTPSFRLEDLTIANGIAHESAHDALSDVHATIAVARLIRERQPRLYDYVYGQRDKRSTASRLNPLAGEPVVHTSARYPAEYGCTALVAPLASHPSNKNGVIVFDLRYDPEPVLSLSAGEIRERLYTPRDALPEGVERIPLKVVHVNRAPVVVPRNTLDPESAERLQIDLARSQAHLARLRQAPGLTRKLREVYAETDRPAITDPDLALYSGGFFGDADRQRMERVHAMTPAQLVGWDPGFEDPRLPELLFRYRARSYPETLTAEESERWERYRRARLTEPGGGGSLTARELRERVGSLRASPDLDADRRRVLDAVEAWAEELLRT